MNRLLQICFGSPIKPAPPAGGSQFAPPLSNHERPAVVASTTGFAGRIRIWALRVATVAIFCGGWSMVRGAGVDFAREIEPILIKRCSECHGPDQQKSKLRLDSRAAAILAGKSGQLALVPGRPDESEMIKRVTASDPDDVMPPKGARLTDREVASLRQWIQEGAIWPEVDIRKHWAFLKPTRPALPQHAGKVRDEAPAPAAQAFCRRTAGPDLARGPRQSFR